MTASSSLSDVVVLACKLPTSGNQATLPVLADIDEQPECPTATGDVTIRLSGTLTIGLSEIEVSGTYLGAQNWAINAATSSLVLSSSISLANAQIVVCSQPKASTGIAAAAAPILTGLPEGTEQLACPPATGAVVISFSGTLTIGQSAKS